MEETQITQKLQKPQISYEDLQKVDIRMCFVKSVEKVENTDKLYKLVIDTGFDERIVVSAIADIFTLDKVLYKICPFVLNLEPRKIRGIISQGMIILAEDKYNRITFPQDAQVGAILV